MTGTMGSLSGRSATARERGNRPVAHLLLFALATGLCVALLAARMHYTGSHGYKFLVWNLFLAWIPFLASWTLSLPRRVPAALLVGIGAIWLAFFPNAPYIVTDFIHLRKAGPAPVWYDAMLIASFAWTGLVLGIVSLRQMQALVRERLGEFAGWAFAAIALCLGGLGVYLGRFERWNSWDLLVQPQAILGDVAGAFLNPLAHQRTIVIILVFTTFLAVAYLLTSTLLGPRFERRERNY